MITVRLTGGMGNQMFQFAAARRLALRHETKLCLSLHWFNTPKGQHRTYRLGEFHLAGDESVETTETPWAELNRGSDLGRPPVHGDRGQRSFQDVLDLPDGASLRGYFQRDKYFADVQDQIRADFQLHDSLRSARIADKMEALKRYGRSLVSLHVRRGDYLAVRPDQALVIDITRVRAAMATFAGAEFVVFSDDRPWCVQHLSGESVHLSPFESDLDELIAMSRCDHHIIANSTFSWWGAWLNPDPGKVVMTPRNWHAGKWPGHPSAADAREDDLDDPAPSTWIRY